MTSPPPSQPAAHVAELEALRRDGRAWHAASRSLVEPTGQVQRLAVPAPAFSILGEQVGLPGFYGAVQENVVTLLGQAHEVTRSLGDTLLAAADAFGQNDDDGAGRFRDAPPAPGGR